MIIGLTGKNGSGKTAVSEYLISRGFEYHSLSDAIREEIRKRGLQITREVLIDVGNELREKFGPGILAERILPNLESDQNYVIDSIRNPQEVDVLRSRSDFTLLALEAEQATRFERSRRRGRENAAQTLSAIRRGRGARTRFRQSRPPAVECDAAEGGPCRNK